MNFAKIIINDLEIKIPVSTPVFESLCDNSEQLEKLPDITYLLKEMFPIARQISNIIIGDTVLEFESEKYFLDAIADSYKKSPEIDEHSASKFDDLLRQSIPFKKRPPTHKQINYATEIATTLSIDLPAKALKSTDSCSQFIDDNLEEFQIESQKKRDFTNQANRVARWAVAFSLSYQGVDLKSIATKLGVAREATVQKYLNSYEEWKDQYTRSDKYYQLSILDLITFILDQDYHEHGPFDLGLSN